MRWCRRLCSGVLRYSSNRSLGKRTCSRGHGTTVQATLTKVPDREISLGDLREAVNTDGIVDELVKYLISGNQNLTTAATHLFSGGGKYLRPTCVMLMGECCNDGHSANYKQRDIALITELIHVASLVHDDVLDSADTRRALSTVNSLFNEKVAILSGDYIIARATSKLARLGCSETITILSSVIRDLIKGEIQQMTHVGDDMFATYLDKTYLKTASLIAHGCQAVALNSATPHLQHVAFSYGRNLGIAFQLVDDMLDFISTAEQLGKAPGSDLKLGLATAPVLYASEEHPQMVELITRGFSRPGDIEKALDLVSQSNGIEKTKSLAELYCNKALRNLEDLPQSHYNTGLSALCNIVVNRTS